MTTAASTFLSGVLGVLFWALFGTAILLAADHIIDRVDPLDFDKEIKNGNIAAAIVMAALIIGVAIIIYGAMLPG
ncbi:MAG: DUF350 domain-containing protein [Chloroflexi bacterium]|nr:DUF350 domain-containing protein [Chloroflexota bacterium]